MGRAGRHCRARVRPPLGESGTGRPVAASMPKRGDSTCLWSIQRHLICANAENPYGMAAVIPVISTSVVNTVAPLDPR